MATEFHTLPVHPSITDPRTGAPLRAIAVLRGRPIWPVMGGDGTDDTAGGAGDQQQGDQQDEQGAGDGDKQGDQHTDDAKLGDAGKRALEREREARKAAEKQARDLAAKVKEHEDKDKSESEKLSERAQTAEERAATAERRLLQMQVALDKGLPVEFAGRLVGDTEEALAADAEKLLPFVGKQDTGDGQQQRFQGGADQGAQDRGGNDQDIKAQIKAAEAKGDVKTSMRLKSALAAQQATASAATT